MSTIEKDSAETIRNGKSAVASARNTVSAAYDEASRRASDAAGHIKDAGQQAAGYVRDQYDHLSDGAHQAYDRARDAASDWEQSAESYVNRRPLQALLIAAGVGVLVGLLWKRHD